MKLLAKIAFILLIMSIITGCSKDNNNANDDYNLIEENGKYYMVLQNSTTDDYGKHHVFPFGVIVTISGASGPFHVTFDSIEEMADDIFAGNFSNDEWQQISKFSRDDSGRTFICNPEKLHYPVFPDSYEKYVIEWYGSAYIMPILDANSTEKGFCTVEEKDCWNTTIHTLQNYEQELTSDAHVKNLSIEYDSHKNAYVYSYSDSDDDPLPNRKEYIYSFDNHGDTYYIHERYEFDYSKDVPLWIKIYGISQDQCFYFYLNEVEICPSIDWLSQFGLNVYIYNPTS